MSTTMHEAAVISAFGNTNDGIGYQALGLARQLDVAKQARDRWLRSPDAKNNTTAGISGYITGLETGLDALISLDAEAAEVYRAALEASQ